MPVFQVRVKSPSGQTQMLQRECETSSALIGMLRAEGLVPVQIEQAASRPGIRIPRLLSSRVGKRPRPRHVLAFIANLATLLRSGMDMERGLRTLEKESTEPLRSVLGGLVERVRQGESLSAAMTRAEAFSPFHVSMVRAGEYGGNLTFALQRIARSIEREQDLKSKIRNATAYPAFLICFGLASLAAMVLFVLPKFTSIYREMNAKLPPMTSFMLSTSTFLRAHAIWIFPLLVLAMVFLSKYVMRFRDNISADQFRMRLPLLGPIVRDVQIARFLRTLGLLTESGIPIVQSLHIYVQIAGSAIFSKATAEIEKGVQMGGKLSAEMRRQQLFSETTLNLVAVGEESGNLGQLMLETSESMEKQIDDLVKTLLTFLEPLLIIAVGVIIGGIVVSMLLPIFSLGSAIRGR